MENTDKLRLIIREEIKKELHEGTKGAILGYLAGVLVDFFLNRKRRIPAEPAEISAAEKKYKEKLEKKYTEDPEFKDIVDSLMAGKKFS